MKVFLIAIFVSAAALGQVPPKPTVQPTLSAEDIKNFWRARAGLLAAQNFETAVHQMLVGKCKGEPILKLDGDPGCPGEELEPPAAPAATPPAPKPTPPAK